MENLFEDIFGLAVCHRDLTVAKFGLENVLFPIGNQFLEIVAPTSAESAGARQLARNRGAGGYMVITQCRAHAPYRTQAAALGVRIVHEFEEPDFVHMQLHPRDTGGSFLEIDEQRGADAHALAGPWAPAGADWQRAQRLHRVTAITAAAIACADPAAVAMRWAALTGCPVHEQSAQWELQFENAQVHFVAQDEDRPDGLTALELATRDRGATLQAAERHGLVTGLNQLTLCGMRITLA